MEHALFTKHEIADEMGRLLVLAKSMTDDTGIDVEHLLNEALAEPLDAERADRLLARVIEVLTNNAERRGDETTVSALKRGGGDLLQAAKAARLRLADHSQGSSSSVRDTPPRVVPSVPAGMVKEKTFHLIPNHNGMKSGPIVPIPVFHEKEIPVVGGFVRTTDIKQWERNERLEIHVGQFRAQYGRSPRPDEVLAIMQGHMSLDGADGDEFDIESLAKSIAANGVRKPPIIDVDGSLLDGNRRLAACMHVLDNTKGEFTTDEKKRAEYIYVWQLTEHATNDDREKVIVSLNFESDHKKDWPKYIKARKVSGDWEAFLNLQSVKPGAQVQRDLKRQLARKYALSLDEVNRFIKMVKWANDFEDHHVNLRKQDPFRVKHAANKYFEYFDELSKGEGAGGVAWTLAQDDKLRQTVFDLLFDGKFENWTQIRALKHIHASGEARDMLAKAHHEADREAAQEHVDNAITIANTKRAEQRSMGANQRIEIFTKWIEEVPPRTFRDEVQPENLRRLLKALDLVKPIVDASLARHEGA